MIRAILICLALVAASFGMARLGYPAPPPGQVKDEKLHQWFESLRDPNTGGACCGEADCRVLPYRIEDRHYQVSYQDHWIDVADDRILKNTINMIGKAIACVHTFEWKGVPEVLCFIPETGT